MQFTNERRDARKLAAKNINDLHTISYRYQYPSSKHLQRRLRRVTAKNQRWYLRNVELMYLIIRPYSRAVQITANNFTAVE